MVRLLWDACQIPDFRKIADDSHARLCARVFDHVAREGHLPTDWLASQIGALARADGDIDTLMQRLSGVRVWTYIAARADWVADSLHWQAEARRVEDLLSDALHERLTARFVDRRATTLIRRLDANDGEALLSAITRRGEVVVEGHPVGQVDGFAFAPDPMAEGDERRLVMRAARRALRAEMPRRTVRLEQAADGAFAVTPDHAITWEGATVARVRPGRTVLRPVVEVIDSEYLDGAARERVRVRLQKFLDDHVRAGLAPLFAAAAAAEADPALRGLLHRLMEAIGLLVGGDAGVLDPALRGRLKAIGVRAGRFALFLPALLKPRPAAIRAWLIALAAGHKTPSLAPPGLVSMPPPADWPPGFAEAVGWIEAGPVLIRLDIAERVGAELHWATRRRPQPVPADLASRFSVAAASLPVILRRLGLRIVPASTPDPAFYGPPSPALLTQAARSRRPAKPHPPRTPPEPRPAAPTDASGPFAALAAWRR